MPNLKVPPEQAIQIISGRIDAMKTMLGKKEKPGFYDFVGWCSKTWSAIDEIYPADDFHPEDIRNIGLPTCSCNAESAAPLLLETYHSRLLDYIDEIGQSMKNRD